MIYKKTEDTLYSGKQSDNKLYLHEKIKCMNLEHDNLESYKKNTFGILGYACDEGVKRNLGRTGTAHAPNSIRKMLAPLANHFSNRINIIDFGNIECHNGQLEDTQSFTSDKIKQLIDNQIFTCVIGGGHDLGYAHYKGVKKAVPNKTIGVINFDAHFDLRPVEDTPNSGTPFYQLTQEYGDDFKYLCLGIQKESNHRELFEIAKNNNVSYVHNYEFTLNNHIAVKAVISNFINQVDAIYLTIDMDGFTSAIAPGVSAPSPLGFNIDIALLAIAEICNSNKLISADIVELNPKYDQDYCTARLASRLMCKIFELKLSKQCT